MAALPVDADLRGRRPLALDIPWLLVVAIVLSLRLLTALVFGMRARSRLPVVARLDEEPLR